MLNNHAFLSSKSYSIYFEKNVFIFYFVLRRKKMITGIFCTLLLSKTFIDIGKNFHIRIKTKQKYIY